MMYEYYFAIMSTSDCVTAYTGTCYKLDYKIDSTENLLKFQELLKKDGYNNPVILFFKQLNE